MTVSVRPETTDDIASVRAVMTVAFGHDDEADLVDRLRTDGDAPIALVAETDGAIVGHILFSPLAFSDGTRVAALAPVAVLPDRQNQGIGVALIEHGLEACRAAGYDAVIVLGEPAYYSRFGFSAEVTRTLDAPFSGDPFMGFELTPGSLAGSTATVRYARAFGIGEAL
jgi:putative acetyltransferase